VPAGVHVVGSIARRWPSRLAVVPFGQPDLCPTADWFMDAVVGPARGGSRANA
jgi:hypothetical protein